MKKRYRFILLGIFLGLAVLLLFVLGKDKKTETKQALDDQTANDVPTINKLLTAPATPTLAKQPTPGAADATSMPPSQAAKHSRATELVQSIYTAPIAFYGKVQDQYGNPVTNARVEYGAVDKFWEPGSNYNGKSDTSGLFSITGIKGAGLTVGVSKEGYDGINGFSYQSFGYGMPPDSNRKAPPSKNSPAMFILRKKAEAESLLRVSSRQYDVTKDGVPAEVNLETGKPVAAGEGHLRIEFWANEQAKDAQGHFSWKCRVSVPGGGLFERNPERDFEAPVDGYRAADEIVMAADNPRQRWSYSAEKQYFLKLADGRYARAKLNFYAGSRTIFVLESYLNTSGSRNLEYDANKKASLR